MNNRQKYDVVVIGAGILGCFAARNLTRYKLKTLLLEASSDVCTGITRANSSIIYAGYDHVPGSLKAELTLRGNASMAALCRELDVPFVRRGSLMTASGPKGGRVLRKKMEHGLANGVEGLKLLTGEEARELEPMLSESVTAALWAPSTGTVNPWQLGIAAYENALQNGCEAKFNTRVLSIQREDGGYVLETDKEVYYTKMVLNCAGLSSADIREMLFPPYIRLKLDASDYLVFDRAMEGPAHILFQESEEKGKGITLVPSSEGNLLVESPARDIMETAQFPFSEGDLLSESKIKAMTGITRIESISENFQSVSSNKDSLRLFATDLNSLADLKTRIADYLPNLDQSCVIRSFAAVRPNPYYVKEENGIYLPTDQKINSFVIDRPEPGFLSLIGIKTPGLTCADQLGQYLANQAADFLEAEENDAFMPERKGIPKPFELESFERKLLLEKDPAYGEVICQCEGITKGEVLEAIRRGAKDLNGIRRRTGLGMGTCQGSRCRREAEKLLKEISL